MAKSSVKESLSFLESCLKRQGLNISQIILFGSHSRGESTEESDIDVAIISEDFKGKNIFKRADLTKEAEIQTIKKYMIPLDIITLTPEELQDETSLLSDYVRNGQLLIDQL
jgi:predicted nucleotidyltransferase